MPLQWRVDPLRLLKESGYSTYRIRKENLFTQTAVGRFRRKEWVAWSDLEKLCQLTGKQPGKLLEYVKDEKTTPCA